MRRQWNFVAFVLGFAIVTAPPAPASEFNDYNGAWQGSGTDRNSPLETAENTRCTMRVNADKTHSSTTTSCRAENFSKSVRMNLTLDAGDRLTGTVTQTVTRSGAAAPETLSGSVTGTRVGETLNLHVRLPGLTPNADIVVSGNPTSFSMRVSSHGFSLMDVTFRRSGHRSE